MVDEDMNPNLDTPRRKVAADLSNQLLNMSMIQPQANSNQSVSSKENQVPPIATNVNAKLTSTKQCAMSVPSTFTQLYSNK